MSRKIQKLAYKIKDLLQGELPGEKAHFKMMPEVRRSFGRNKTPREAAVILLIFPEDRYIKIALIRRTMYDGDHSGQISFPGGTKEETDHDHYHTCIRETAEETGIPEEDINIIGKLSPIYIPISAFVVQPFIAYIDYTPEFKPDPTEVQYMINIPVIHFLRKENIKKEKWNLSGMSIKVPFYIFMNHKIWGATAMILSEFIDLIEAIGPDQWILQYSDNGYNGK
jgi:8-oxo-dGTP pyrophosphatase MutT (NUDIX family)